MTAVVRQTLRPLASLRLTVFLLAASMFLVFVGTLAQVEHGIWETVRLYFRSWVVKVPLQLLVPHDAFRMPGWLPFPGGFVVGGLLLINLLAAHTLRFKVTWKRSGVLLIHGGMILLLVGELVTALYADEGLMMMREGESTNFIEDAREVEFAITRPDPNAAATTTASSIEEMIAIPRSWFRRAASAPVAIEDDRLPFDISFEEYMPNALMLGPAQARTEGLTPSATHGAGTQVVAKRIDTVSGTDINQTTDQPAAIVTISRDGQTVGRWLVATQILRQPVEIDGETWDIALRFKRTYKPYTIKLIDFEHDRFVGTQTARNFASEIEIHDPEHDQSVRHVRIWMNHPLRYRGDTFYQASFLEGDIGTVLQVVRNPGWLIPYISCGLVTLGMLVHFGIKLIQFMKRSAS